MGHDEGGERARSAYGYGHARLAAITAEHDRTKSFRIDQNMAPAG